MISMDAVTAASRMKRLDSLLSNLQIEGLNHTVDIGASYAFEDFENLNFLESTIKAADVGMYKQKQFRKGLMAMERSALLELPESNAVLAARS